MVRQEGRKVVCARTDSQCKGRLGGKINKVMGKAKVRYQDRRVGIDR